MPQAVIEGGKAPRIEPWMVDYGQVTGVLTEARKELVEQNTNLINELSQISGTIRKLKNDNETVKAENEQLKEKLAALADRQVIIEEILLALSTNLPKEKLVKLNQAGLNEVQKSVQ